MSEQSRRHATRPRMKKAVAAFAPESSASIAGQQPYHDYAVVLDDGRFKSDDDAQALQAWFDRCEADTEDRPIVIHFHGGLVSESSGLKSAAKIVGQIYDPAGAIPLCIVWKTGPADVIRTGLSRIVTESIFRKVVDKVLGKLKDKVSEGALANFSAPTDIDETPSAATGVDFADVLEFSDAELAEFEREVAGDAELRAELAAIADEDVGAVIASLFDEPHRLSQRTRMDAAVVAEIRQDLSQDDDAGAMAGLDGLRFAARVAKVLWNVGRRFVSKRDHGLHATVVEEIARALYLDAVGEFAWSEMKRYTREAFEPGARYGGTALLEGLGRLLEMGISRRVVLVGHSAGAIYVCKLLEAAHGVFARINTEAAARFAFDVVLLAPAVRYDVFDATIRTAGPRIAGFRMFAMHDELERKDSLIDHPALKHLYPSSLLYLVSGICEGEADVPLLGMERFHRFVDPFSAARFPEIQRVRDWLSSRPNRLVLSKTGDKAPTGLRSTAVDHGAFDDKDTETMGSVQAIVSAGGHAAGTGLLSVVDGATAKPFDGFPAGATGDTQHEFNPSLFTGRTLLRMPKSGKQGLANQFRNLTGVTLDAAESAGDVAQILDANAAAQLPASNIAVAHLSADQVARLSRGHSLLAALASRAKPEVFSAPERWAYLAQENGGSLGDFLDGYEAATDNLLTTLRQHRRASSAVAAPASAMMSPVSDYSAALTAIRVTPQTTRSGAGVRICVIDTGIDQHHPDIVASFGPGKRQLVCKSFVASESPHDHHGHGTHCAGLATGPLQTALGYRYGVASHADLYVARVFNARNRASESDVMLALGWARSMQCAVASMSLVFRTVSEENDDLFDEVVTNATEGGVLVVAACGNDSDRSRGRRVGVYHPAAYAPSVAVAAVHNGAPANFSNSGVRSGGRNPDIAAPGVDIVSSVSGPKQYAAMSGTSMATPLVAGVAALLAESVGGTTLRGTELRRALLSNTKALGYGVEDVGVGLVQAPTP